MKNKLKLAELGLTEIPRTVSKQINGGWFLPIAVGLLAKLLIDEWDTTKRAAVDAWNGNYNPPT